MIADGLRALLLAFALVVCTLLKPSCAAEPPPSEGAQVMQGFNQPAQPPPVDEQLRTRHKVMFLLGIPLLLLLLATAGLGIATGLFGKQLFVLHMLFAGLSLTLAIVHAIVGLVWFFPF